MAQMGDKYNQMGDNTTGWSLGRYLRCKESLGRDLRCKESLGRYLSKCDAKGFLDNFAVTSSGYRFIRIII